MQFQNTSDTATRTETDKQDCSGELHAKLLEETETGELHDTRARHAYDTPSEGFVSCKPPAATGAQATNMPQHPRHNHNQTKLARNSTA